MIKHTAQILAVGFLSLSAYAAELLPDNGTNYKNMTMSEAGAEKFRSVKGDGFTPQDPITKKVGERLYRARLYYLDEVVRIKLDKDLLIVGQAPLFGTDEIHLAAREYLADFKIKNNSLGYLYHLPNLGRFGTGLFIDANGKVFPQLIKINSQNSNLLNAHKLESIGDANFTVNISTSENNISVFDVYLNSIENGLVSITLNCFDANGSLAAQKKYQYSDSASRINMAENEFDVINSTKDSITIRAVRAPQLRDCTNLR